MVRSTHVFCTCLFHGLSAVPDTHSPRGHRHATVFRVSVRGVDGVEVAEAWDVRVGHRRGCIHQYEVLRHLHEEVVELRPLWNVVSSLKK